MALFSQLLTQVQAQLAERPSGTVLSESWQALQGRFPAIWIADGSTLEELRRQLSAQQVCDLYRRRWLVEDAFCITKRLLGLAYVWVGDINGIQIQIVATWIFYAVLNDLCA